jgi:hypothetical protein
MVPIRLTNGHQLAEAHAKHILLFYSRHYGGSDVSKIDKWLKSNLNKDANFEAILAAQPETLKELVREYSKKGNPAFNESVARIKTVYKYFRTPDKNMPFLKADGGPYNGFQLASAINMTVCPYCNRNYIVNVPQIGMATCQLDHFHDKAAYPFLALSFYNLIPTCGTCNHIKKDNKVELCNLYDEDLQEKTLMNFGVSIKGSNYLDDPGELLPEFNCDPIFINNFYELKLDKLYMQHIDLMQEIVKKRHLYNSDYIDQLFAAFEGKLFKTREQLLNFLLANFIEEDQLHKRPFSKLTKDIWEQLSYLDR